MTTKPWIGNSPLHHCGGPIVPADAWDHLHDAAEAKRPALMHCCACGSQWEETDPSVIARAWWNEGAWCVVGAHQRECLVHAHECVFKGDVP